MSSLATIAPKLSKLIPMLATDHDGEVVAAARAIDRTLKSAGLDLHDLAQALAARGPVAIPGDYAAPEPAPQPSSLRDIASWLRTHATHRMNFKERQFVADMASRLSTGRQASAKQEKWLQTLFYRLYGIGGEYVP
ncbi:hypothetical protein ACFOYU_00165 [Microvirga sp. GCM10011540]|uniref:hypothetical protein n=1 Tax=Microvirga sp. GCM10011540 TaxID=3317338 RepID=UPI00361C80F4